MTAMIKDQAATALVSPTSPAPRRVTVRPAARREPRYDDEHDTDTAPRLVSLGQPDPMLPFAPCPDRLTSPRSWAAARPTGRSDLPDPQLWARRLVIALLETRAGRRPLRQLAPHLSPSVLTGLAESMQRGQWRAPHPGALRALRSCEPADGVAEIAAVIDMGARCQALAARIEGLDGRWRCVRLQLG
jgi:hypothetical protein